MGCVVSMAQSCVGEVEHPTAKGIWQQLTSSDDEQIGVSLITFSQVASNNRVLSQWLTDCSIKEGECINDACKRVFANIGGGDESCSEITRAQFFEYFESTRRPFRVFILGAPGVGKSTLINKIAGLQEDDIQACKTAQTVNKCTAELQFISLPKAMFESALDQTEFNTVELGDLPGCGELVDDQVVVEALREYSGTWNAAIVVDELGGRLGPETIVTLNMFAMAFKEVSAWDNVIYTCSKADKAEADGLDREKRLKEREDEINERFKSNHDKSLQDCQIKHSCCVSSRDEDVKNLIKLLCKLIAEAKDLGAGLGAVRSEDQMASAPIVIESHITEVNRAQMKISANRQKFLFLVGVVFFLFSCLVMALPTYPALYCERAVHYQPYGFCYAGVEGGNGTIKHTVESKHICTFRLQATNTNYSQPTCHEHCANAMKPASSCVSVYEAKNPASCEFKESLGCSDTSPHSMLCTCKQLHCEDIQCPKGYRRYASLDQEVPNYWLPRDQIEHCCTQNICDCASGKWKFSTSSPCLHDGATLCTECDEGFKMCFGKGIYKHNPPVCCPHDQDVGTDSGQCTFCSCKGGKPGKDCVEDGADDCDSCREGFHFVDAIQGRCLECLCQHGQPGNDCVVDGAHNCQSCDEGYHMQDGFCISCKCPRGTPSDQCTEDGALLCASCDDKDYFVRDGQCMHCVCPNGRAGTTCTDDGGLDCESCFSEYSKVSGECIKRCKCPNGIPGNDCDEEFGPDCASCHSGYHTNFDNRCISCYCANGIAGDSCDEDGETDCVSCYDEYTLHDDECTCENVFFSCR